MTQVYRVGLIFVQDNESSLRVRDLRWSWVLNWPEAGTRWRWCSEGLQMWWCPLSYGETGTLWEPTGRSCPWKLESWLPAWKYRHFSRYRTRTTQVLVQLVYLQSADGHQAVLSCLTRLCVLLRYGHTWVQQEDRVRTQTACRWKFCYPEPEHQNQPGPLLLEPTHLKYSEPFGSNKKVSSKTDLHLWNQIWI